MKKQGWKLILILGLLAIFTAGIFVGAPDSWDRSVAAMKSGGWLAGVQQNIHLGLDLRGGTHLILQVVVNDAVNAETDQAVERLKGELSKKNIAYADIQKPDPANHPEQVLLKGVPPEATSDVRQIVSDRLPEYDLASGAENSWTVTMKSAAENALKDQAVTQAIETIRNRIDGLGVSEPVIQQHGLGEYQILVQLPGVDDPARVKDIMQSTALLEIKQAMAGGPYPSEAAALAGSNGVLPPDQILLKGKSAAAATSGTADSADQFYLVSRASAITGRDMRAQGASVTQDEQGRPAVSFALTAEGGQKFGNFTGSHVNELLAVVLDNKVMEVATIQEQIRDSGRITGRFTPQAAKDLTLILNSGSLPATIRYLEERTVGPSLGADSIKAGVQAAIIGMLAVMIFMLVYYRGAGINADLALFLNLVILLGFLGFTGATLTLPGIAGVILTIGMGVDSNVLIFERIREELRAGKTAAAAVEQGFGHAWLTIVDTHVTTIVSAAILFVFGTGPVRGFAVTLAFGLAANLFTAVFVSRTIFNWLLSRKKPGEALSI